MQPDKKEEKKLRSRVVKVDKNEVRVYRSPESTADVPQSAPDTEEEVKKVATSLNSMKTLQVAPKSDLQKAPEPAVSKDSKKSVPVQ